MSQQDDATGLRPTFRELRRKLVDAGCHEVWLPVLGPHGGPEAPKEAFILNPQNGEMIPVEHWVDEDEVSPSICDFVCRRLKLDEKAIALDSPSGSVRVMSPRRETPN